MPAKNTANAVKRAGRNTPGRQRLTVSRIERLTLPPDRKEAILWDADKQYLGVRLRSGKKVFIYYRKVNGRPLRLSIAPVDSLTIEQARREADRITGLIAQGIDPREDKLQHIEAAAAARSERDRAKVTFGDLWDAYVKANQDGWGERHKKDHGEVMAEPGLKRKRSSRKTVAGVLWPLRSIMLGDLTPMDLQVHMAKEAAKRPTTTSKAFRLLRACLRWGRLQPDYEGLYDAERLIAAAGKKVQKSPKPKTDVLQKEQLKAWFKAVKATKTPAIGIYLQALLLTGARPGELLGLKWADVDFQWNTLTIRDKVEGERIIPLTPYVRVLLQSLPHHNEWVFTSGRIDGPIVTPAKQHGQALAAAGLPHITQHGLRRSFGSLSEWVEAPTGVVAQIMGHKPSATAERHYRVRPVDLLRMWHTKIEAWMLKQAGIKQPKEDAKRLEVVK